MFSILTVAILGERVTEASLVVRRRVKSSSLSTILSLFMVIFTQLMLLVRSRLETEVDTDVKSDPAVVKDIKIFIDAYGF